MLSWPILTQDSPPDTQSTTKNRYQWMIAILWVWASTSQGMKKWIIGTVPDYY